MQVVMINAEPRKGFEFKYWLAWKHRITAGELLSNKWLAVISPRKHTRVMRLWTHAMDRIDQYGQNTTREV